VTPAHRWNDVWVTGVAKKLLRVEVSEKRALQLRGLRAVLASDPGPCLRTYPPARIVTRPSWADHPVFPVGG
jgi:hypothetical protein